MAKKTKKTAKAKKSGVKPKKRVTKSAAKKKVALTKSAKVKKSSATKRTHVAVKASKPKRKSVAPRKGSTASGTSRSRKIPASKSEVTNPQANNPHQGMMGDGTEEQNLNQKGNPRARITQDDVDAAFKESN